MSNLKKIKDKIETIARCKVMCDSMYNLSSMKIMKLKKQQKEKKEELEYLGGVLYYLNMKLIEKSKKKLSFVFFSDFGFCGEFNSYNMKSLESEPRTILPIGKKSHSNMGFLTSDFAIFKEKTREKIENNKNFEFIIKNFFNIENFTIHFNSFIQPNLSFKNINFSKNINKTIIEQVYLNLFLEYVFILGNLHENYYRSLIMKNAVENSKEWQKDLTINLNKIRQNSITNEILLIISGQQQETK